MEFFYFSIIWETKTEAVFEATSLDRWWAPQHYNMHLPVGSRRFTDPENFTELNANFMETEKQKYDIFRKIHTDHAHIETTL